MASVGESVMSKSAVCQPAGASLVVAGSRVSIRTVSEVTALALPRGSVAYAQIVVVPSSESDTGAR